MIFYTGFSFDATSSCFRHAWSFLSMWFTFNNTSDMSINSTEVWCPHFKIKNKNCTKKYKIYMNRNHSWYENLWWICDKCELTSFTTRGGIELKIWGWKFRLACSDLNQYYKHSNVNHHENCVIPEEGSNTRSIDGSWLEAKMKLWKDMACVPI